MIMTRGKIIGLALLIGLIFFLFALVRSCHSGSEVMNPPENEQLEGESIGIPRQNTPIPSDTATGTPAQADTAASDTSAALP
jgi:hypothetical protein